jgi:formylglycine-generating enzyme required for sulfatase activity
VIFTFYSFKGGVGRSMALANVADVLAQRGLRVLVIDFDLEAPGLERYYPINYGHARAQPGVIDLLLAFKASLTSAVDHVPELDFRQLDRFILPVYPSTQSGGALSLMSAGRREPAEAMRQYALHVRSFDWHDFYFNWEGAAFFEWLRKRATSGEGAFDVVLVDSRTGVTEMGGICAYRLADAVVMLCAANQQNLSGTRSVADDFKSSSVIALRNDRPLDLVVVPARIEQRDPALLERYKHGFSELFQRDTPPRLRELGVSFESLAIPYEPEYAFEERVMSSPGARGARGAIDAAFERIADVLTVLARDGKLAAQREAAQARLASGVAPTAQASAPVARYDLTTRFAGYDVFVSAHPHERQLVERLVSGLQARGLSVFSSTSSLSPEALNQALLHSRAVLVVAGAHGVGDWQKFEVKEARAAERRLVAALLPGAEDSIFSLALQGLADTTPFDLRPAEDGNFEACSAFTPLCELLANKSARVTRAAVPSDPEPERGEPYPGLRAFGEDDASVFFGREAERDELLDFIANHSLTVLGGASGVGKTSLVLAGVFPRLRAEPARPWNLRHADARSLGACVAELSAFAREAEGSDGRALLFVDHIDSCGPAQALAREPASELRAALERAIEAAERNPASAKLVLATRKSLDEATRSKWPTLARAFDEAAFGLGAPAAAALRAALEKPAASQGAAFEPGLVDRILKDIGEESCAFALVQLVMAELWRRQERGFLVHSVYTAVEGALGLLTRHAESCIAGLEPERLAQVRSLLLRLVSVADAKASEGSSAPSQSARPKQAIWELFAGQRTLARNGAEVLELLVEAHLVTLRRETSHRLAVSVSLSGLLGCWSTLRDWIAQSEELLREREAVESGLELYELSKRNPQALLSGRKLKRAVQLMEERRDELSPEELNYVSLSAKARKRRISELFFAGVIGVSVVTTAAYTAWVKTRDQREAQRLANEAEAQVRAAEAEARKARDRADEARKLAARASDQASEEGARAEEYERLLRAQNSATAVGAPQPVRVFIQYNDQRDASLVKELATALSDFQVPPTDRRPEFNCGEVRYFFGSDKAASDRVLTSLRSFFAGKHIKLEPTSYDLSKKFPSVREGTLEVWLPPLAELVSDQDASIRNSQDGSEMRLVPAGCMVTGSSPSERSTLIKQRLKESYAAYYDWERPLREAAWAPAFYMHKYEVTNRQYQQYRSAVCTTGGACGPWVPMGGPNVPAANVSWKDADAYCRWAGGRLPSEDEWEKAARGVSGNVWPWGNEPDPTRVRTESKVAVDVGGYPTGDSPYGISDLAGSLWELTTTLATDGHVMKGGSFLNTLGSVRSAVRWTSSRETTGAAYLGFRCVQSLAKPAPFGPAAD